jgi:hypothetical protein
MLSVQMDILTSTNALVANTQRIASSTETLASAVPVIAVNTTKIANAFADATGNN